MLQADGQVERAINLITKNLQAGNKAELVSLMELYVLSGRYEAGLEIVAPYLKRIADLYDMLLNYYALAILLKQNRHAEAKETALALRGFKQLPKQISANIDRILKEVSRAA